MTTAERELIELVLRLPPELQGKVRDFVESLLQKQQGVGAHPSIADTAQTLCQDWAGALAHLGRQYDSVALQHQAADWMSEGALKQTGGDVPR